MDALMVWRNKRERHERKNTVAALVVIVILVVWLVDWVRGWF